MHSSLLPTLSFLFLLTTPLSSTTPIITKRSSPSPPTLSNLSAVSLQAGGSIPNTPLPDTISRSATTAFQTINFLENLESAFFLAALNNLTSNTFPTPTNSSINLPFTTDVIRAIHAQELIHVATAEAILTHYGSPTFQPCKYAFPVTTLDEFIALADIITVVCVGAVIDVASSLALTDPALVPGPASILAIETRHDAFFRQNLAAAAAAVGGQHHQQQQKQQQLIPNPAPFDTRISSGWALNLGSPFVVPGSCSAGMPEFAPLPPLKVAGVVGSKVVVGSEGPIGFVVDPAQVKMVVVEGQKYWVGWVNQADEVKYTDATVSRGGEVTSTIPAGMGGMAFAALTAQDEAKDVGTLTGLTVAGPAPVRIS